jgi:hypothetical protein
MVPSEFLSFFIASTGAAAALAGLLFVAVSLAPDRMVTRQAPLERRAVAGSAFTALINAFFTSLVALIPHINFGMFVIPFSLISLATSLLQAWPLLRLRKGWQSLLRRGIMVLISIGLYGLELTYGIGLIRQPFQVGFVYSVLFVLLGCFGLGLIRAWELLGVQRFGLGGWLNPLQDTLDRQAGESASPAQHPEPGSVLFPPDENPPRLPSAT